MLTLDVGCGWVKGVQKKRGEIGIDINRGMCDIVSDAHHLPFREGIFDKILLYSVLEHLDNPLKCLMETARVAKAGARFEIIIPVETCPFILELGGMLLEFPFGVVAAFNRCWRRHKYRKTGALSRKNSIQSRHIARYASYLELVRVEKAGTHSWFQGRKGKLLRKILRRAVRIGAWKGWFIEAVKRKER